MLPIKKDITLKFLKTWERYQDWWKNVFCNMDIIDID